MNIIIETLYTVGPFFLLLGLLIFIHELGHFAVARYFGVRVEAFSIGFGKKLIVYKYGDTEYRLSIFPLGGYVKMFGDNPTAEVPPEEQEHSFIHKPVYARIAIVLAGPMMNLILAAFVFFAIGLYGEPKMSPVLGDLEKSSMAYKSGLRSGDKIVSVNGTKTSSFDQSLVLISNAGSEAKIQVKRDNNIKEFLVPTATDANPNILSSRRNIPQIEGLTPISKAATVAFDSKDSDLYKAGLRSLDEVTQINEIKINNLRDFDRFIIDLPANPAKEFNIHILRPDAKGIEEKLEFKVTGKNFEYESADTYIGRAQQDSPAKEAGLQRGDKIIAIGSTKISSWKDLVETVKSDGLKSEPLVFTISRNFERSEITVKPQIKSMMDEKGKEISRPLVGIEPALYIQYPEQIFVAAGGIVPSAKYAVSQTWKWTIWTINSIKRVVQGEVSHKNLGGFITIGQVAKESFKVGWSYFFQMMGIISINLFLLNLLPIPVLDGGHLLFYLIESVRGKPVSPQKMEIAFMFGFALLMSLVGLTLFNDVQRVFFSGW